MVLIFLISVLFSFSLYLILDANLIKKIFGFLVFSSAINLIILISGRLRSTYPAFLVSDGKILSNALAQAIILTAIVIGFALLCMLMVFLKDRKDNG